MGKASKWFRGLLGLKNTDSNQNQALKAPAKKKWSFAKSHKEKTQQKPHHAVVSGGEHEDDANKHAIAVAAATAAVAEAAVAAAQAAAAVVQLTSSGRNITMAGSGGDVGATACVTQSGAGYGSREEWAAVIVQSHFRAYLSRRALRALKALVKLQALVRGHLIRKQTAYTMRRLQALVRAQVRARAGRVVISESPHSSIKSSHYNYPGPATPEKFEHVIRARSTRHEQSTMLKRNGSKSKNNHMDRLWEESSNTRNDKILEVDPGNSHINSKRRNLFYSSYHNSDKNSQSFSTSKDSTARQSVLSPSSGEAQSSSPLKFTQEVDQTAFCTADNSPTFCSASTKSCLSGFSDNPSYMSYTQSSKAKVRSLSAPKQRLSQFERSSSSKRYSVHGYGESRSASVQRASALHASFANRGYPGSGRLDSLGMPVRGDMNGFSGGLQRY